MIKIDNTGLAKSEISSKLKPYAYAYVFKICIVCMSVGYEIPIFLHLKGFSR